MYTNLISLKVLDCSDFKMNLLLYKILPIWVGNYFFCAYENLSSGHSMDPVRFVNFVKSGRLDKILTSLFE